MSSLASWIDSGAVTALARDLCPVDEGSESLPSPTVVGPPARYAGGNMPEGRGLRQRPAPVAEYPPEEEAGRVRDKLERIKALARSSGLLAPGVEISVRETPPSDDGEKEIEQLEIPDGALGVRLGAFAEWAARAAGGATVFVIDSQGYPLIDQETNPDLLAAALLLADASQRAAGHVANAGSASGLLQMEVGADEMLTVMPVETQYGTLCLGIQHRIVIGKLLAERLRDGLLGTLNC